MKTSAYLNFDGNCAEAFQFYAKTFPGKDLHIMKQGDTQKDAKASEKDWVLHAYLKIGDADIMASDTFNHTKPAGMHAR
jgi:PhnB protein